MSALRVKGEASADLELDRFTSEKSTCNLETGGVSNSPEAEAEVSLPHVLVTVACGCGVVVSGCMVLFRGKGKWRGSEGLR